ncbi:MAG: PAS domain-containing protein [Deltaproteobacteria bacterium]|nr:PAS domain-containing protein [Deltaproteobacteria bacterium]
MSKKSVDLTEKQVAALPAGLLVADARGRVVHFNGSAQSLTQKGEEEVVGKKSWAAFFDKRGPTVIDEAMDEGERIEGEVTLADGSKLWVVAEPTFDDEGEPDGAVAVLSTPPAGSSDDGVDTRSALDAATSAVMMADTERNITYLNKAAMEMFKDAEGDIQQALPRFVAADVLGTNIDAFHKNPSHQATILDGLSSAYKTNISVGARTFGIIATPTWSLGGDKTGFVVEWQDRTAELKEQAEKEKLAATAAQVGIALDKATTNIMIADVNNDVIYMNESILLMMQRNADELRKQIPGFDPNNLVGQNIDVFHKTPAHQRNLIAGLTSPYTANLNLGAVTLRIVMNPIYDASGTRQGTVTEWEDRTAILAAEEKQEELQSKISDDGEELQRKVDVILEAVQQAVRGDFSVELPDFGDDTVGKLAKGVSGMVGSVKSVVGEIQGLISAAQDGRLSHRADASGFDGGFKDVVQGVNDTVEALLAPVTESQQVLEQIANYDLRARVTTDFSGDHNLLKNSLNESGEVLHGAIAQVNEAVGQIMSASDQIARSSQDVADGASNQASSLEETSSSLEEMSSMTKLNADNAQQADAMAKAAQEAASKGSSAMEEMNVSMGEIRQSSEDTSAIIKDINEIAFQTNLLALNAAVEAARAGDAGRGFAVVAEEVRNLAQRSKEAAQKTETLINQSVKLADNGTRITNEATTRLGEIGDTIAKVTALVGEIASASAEQARGIEQVNTAVTTMDKVTQANASASEQSSSAAEELAAQAKELQAMVGRFELNGNEASLGGGGAGIAVPMRQPQAAPQRPVAPSASLSASDLIPLDNDPDFADF